MEKLELLVEAASHAGIVGSAMPDVLTRATSHFGPTEVNPEQVAQFLAGLRETAPHLFAQHHTGPPTPAEVSAHYGIPLEVWQRMSPADRRTWARKDLPPVVRQRPYEQPPLTLTPEQQQELAQLVPMARLAKYRELQAQQQGRG